MHFPMFGRRLKKNIPGNKLYLGNFLTHDLPIFIPMKEELECFIPENDICLAT